MRKFKLQSFPVSRATIKGFYQATGVIWYMKGEHAVMGAAQIGWEDLRNEQLCVATLTC